MRCYLLNTREIIIHAFDALDLPEARGILRTRCLADGVSYDLAITTRRGTFSNPKPAAVFDDQPA